MRTQFSSGHSAPVYALDFVDEFDEDDEQKNDDIQEDEATTNPNTNTNKKRRARAKHIITISNDARICVWRDDYLVEPRVSYRLSLQQKDLNKNLNDEKKTNIATIASVGNSSNNSEDLPTTCFSTIASGNVTIFGSDEGCLYKCNENIRSDAFLSGNLSSNYAYSASTSSNSGIGSSSLSNLVGGGDSNANAKVFPLNVNGLNNYINDETSKASNKRFAHFGPVTTVECHPYFSRYNAVSDHSTQLYLSSSYDWNIKLWHNKKSQPLFTFAQMADYIYDVKWSPVRPSVFVCGDGLGKLTVFDLINDFESPATQLSIAEERQQLSITKLLWQKDGKSLFVADSEGAISLYDTNPSLYETTETDFELFETVIRTAVNQM